MGSRYKRSPCFSQYLESGVDRLDERDLLLPFTSTIVFCPRKQIICWYPAGPKKRVSGSVLLC